MLGAGSKKPIWRCGSLKLRGYTPEKWWCHPANGIYNIASPQQIAKSNPIPMFNALAKHPQEAGVLHRVIVNVLDSSNQAICVAQWQGPEGNPSSAG